HAHGTGAGHREGHLVPGPERVAEELLELVHHAHELGVEVTDGRARHGIEDTLVDVRRTGAHEHAPRRLERRDPFDCGHDPVLPASAFCDWPLPAPLDYTRFGRAGRI